MVLAFVVGLVVGFVVGILVGRKNPKTVETVVTDVKNDASKVGVNL